MPKYWLNVLIMLLIAVAWPIHSKEQSIQYLGVTIPKTYNLPSNGSPLVLNGYASRYLWGVEAYVAVLYTVEQQDNPNMIILSDAPAVMRFHFVQDNIAPHQITSMLRTGITLNSPHIKDSATDIKRLKTLLDAIDKEIHAGDTLSFLYLPDEQTLIVMRNRKEIERFTRSKRFFNMLLKMWVGKHPPSREFKNEILGEVTH